MQTFLPYPSFFKSAECLDDRRLGKQRVETLQILNVLIKPGEKTGWQHHPAAKMWRGYEQSLGYYGLVICTTWKRRGFNDTCFKKIRVLFPGKSIENLKTAPKPFWVGDEDFHRAHQSNLIRKAPEFYRPLFPGVPNNLPYIWPTNG